MRGIQRTFENLRERREAALIAYVTGGDPEPRHTGDVIRSLITGGADIVEVGIPFSDPIADGPTIQAAVVRALKAGATPYSVIETVKEIKRSIQTPIVLLTYFNPIFRIGQKKFLNMASDARVDGLIIPELPLEESTGLKAAAEAAEIDTIFMVAPSSSEERLKRIVDHSSGFLYLVSHYGVTGAKESMRRITMKLISRTTPYTRKRIPLAVGFGLSQPQHVRSVIVGGADGAIVGSALVDIIAQNREDVTAMLAKLEAKTRALKRATQEKH